MIRGNAIFPCLCLSCGVRNDYNSPHGYCANGHDNWLEYRDVLQRNEWYFLALKMTGLSESEFEEIFQDPTNKMIPLIH